MEEDLRYDVQTRNVPQRRRWYTRLWHSCLGCTCINRQRRRKFTLFYIGYDPTGPLQRAASVGDLDKTERLIHSSQHHVDESDRRNRTSLHYACAHNHPDVVLLLLENNSSVNIRDDEGCTPLIKAAQQGNIHCVSVLLDYNADPNVMDIIGNTAFHHAVSRGNLPIVKMLLKHNVDIEAKTKYGLTPLQLATFEQKPEMVEFLEAMCATAHAPTPAQETGVKHVSFNEKVFCFEDERPLSCGVRPRGQLKSILKNSSQDNIGKNIGYGLGSTRLSVVDFNGYDYLWYRFCVICFLVYQHVEGYKPENCHQIHQEHRISVPEAPVAVEPTPTTSAADIGATMDIELTPSTSAAVIGATVGIESTPSPSATDSEFSGRRRFSVTPRENLEFLEWLDRGIMQLNMEIEATSSQSNADRDVPADTEPIPPTSAASSRAPADIEITPSQCAADSGAIAEVEATFAPGPTDIAESDETHDSETASDIELDSISDLAVYMEHARDTPWADPEPTPGPHTCYSIDSTERADLNNLTLLKAQDKYDSFSLDEEPIPVSDLDEHLAPTQDANVFYDNLLSVDHTGHSKTTVREPGYLPEQENLLMMLMPFLWLLAYLLSIIAGISNLFQQVWHEENGQGPPTNRKEGSVAAAADHLTLETGDTTH
ncbi:uncharacterized protein LOC127671140 [Apodemus sylvaticus]|uniref:uncharacterized protein LOC127671140 n=1 Tax=Apodemus sylvaticus TaxID=10129 RepID=UPI002242C272|nr:uncharacterized protein LOC127671140 [Apodemus sylvaticus]